ncbi:hypothetical protein BRADI_3g34195v3 [Brachypodium distachyon]|uniref:Uncharacterized protein n=1 Tax=Brachypodium distachyon TaxID=15368 RepID=A0A2K2D0Z5_BRADI|nr:hypothetical protein BRADI_3g34195v3 [Brachypodium distachyon]
MTHDRKATDDRGFNSSLFYLRTVKGRAQACSRREAKISVTYVWRRKSGSLTGSKQTTEKAVLRRLPATHICTIASVATKHILILAGLALADQWMELPIILETDCAKDICPDRIQRHG